MIVVYDYSLSELFRFAPAFRPEGDYTVTSVPPRRDAHETRSDTAYRDPFVRLDQPEQRIDVTGPEVAGNVQAFNFCIVDRHSGRGIATGFLDDLGQGFTLKIQHAIPPREFSSNLSWIESRNRRCRFAVFEFFALFQRFRYRNGDLWVPIIYVV